MPRRKFPAPADAFANSDTAKPPGNLKKLQRFVLAGLSAALVNLGLMALLVEAAGFRGAFLENLANFIAIEASIIYNFFLSRGWTWRHAPRRAGRALFFQCLSFNGASLFTIAARVILFALLQKTGLDYLVNTVVGIALAAGVNFFFYDRLVFRPVK